MRHCLCGLVEESHRSIELRDRSDTNGIRFTEPRLLSTRLASRCSNIFCINNYSQLSVKSIITPIISIKIHKMYKNLGPTVYHYHNIAFVVPPKLRCNEPFSKFRLYISYYITVSLTNLVFNV